jgi:hypothetical protein
MRDRFVEKHLTGHLEFSKTVVLRGMAVFLVQLILTIVVLFLKTELSVHMVALMNATVPLYIVIFGGYFGKAGVENYNKIKYWDREVMDTPCVYPAEEEYGEDNFDG